MAEGVTEKVGAIPIGGLRPSEYGPAGIINVREYYDWTLAPAGYESRRDVPLLRLTQYELDANALLANLKYWTRPIFNDKSNPYEGLYRAKFTKVVFELPWFEDYHHNITQNWEDFKGLESTDIGEKMIKGAAILTNSPGVSINTPKIWKGAARSTVPYNITLFNTTGRSESIIKNKQFVNRLIASTLHDQQNPVLAGPPTLYEMEIPGVRFCPACVISNLIITNLGVLIKTPIGLVPEAFKISFQLNELISESRQIYDGATAGGVLIKSIINPDSEEAQRQNQAYEQDQANLQAPPPQNNPTNAELAERGRAVLGVG
jgi:hypothetical protein